MKIRHSSIFVFVLLVCGAVSVGVFCGCEGDPDMENVGSEFDDGAGGDQSRPDT